MRRTSVRVQIPILLSVLFVAFAYAGCGPTSHALRLKLMVPKKTGFVSVSEGRSTNDGTVFLFTSPVKYPSKNYLTEYYDDKEIGIALVVSQEGEERAARLLVLHHGYSPTDYNDSSCAPVNLGPIVQHYDKATMHVVDSTQELKRLSASLVPLNTEWIVLARKRSTAELEEVVIIAPGSRTSRFPEQLSRDPIAIMNCQRLPSRKDTLLRIVGPLGYILAVPFDIITFPIWIWGLAPVG